VSHHPPLVFNVERDPGEKEPVTPHTWDGPDCSGASCLATFIAAATKAVREMDESVVWCEYCKADNVEGRSMLSSTVDRSVMDCRGLHGEPSLPAAQSGCCKPEGGDCAPGVPPL